MQMSRCHWHWFYTNWTYHFSPRYFNGIKIATAFKYIFKDTMPKLSVNFGNHISQDSHKNQYPGPICNFGFTASLYGDKCWSNLPLQCRIFRIDNTLRSEVTGSPVRSSDSCAGWIGSKQTNQGDHPIHALVGLFGTSYHVLALKHNNMTSSLYQRIQNAQEPYQMDSL